MIQGSDLTKEPRDGSMGNAVPQPVLNEVTLAEVTEGMSDPIAAIMPCIQSLISIPGANVHSPGYATFNQDMGGLGVLSFMVRVMYQCSRAYP